MHGVNAGGGVKRTYLQRIEHGDALVQDRVEALGGCCIEAIVWVRLHF
jgi:hypothetical protein